MAHPIFDITGRTALVTGSSRGIGRALAAGLVEAGCEVIVNGRDGERVRRAADELGARALPFDNTDPGAVARAVLDAGPIDILVNNTGMQYRAPFTEFPDEQWHALLATNLTSAFLVGREVAKGMVSRGAGKMINVLSLQSEVARPGIAAYSATKGALKMLTKGMCADLAPHGIQVNGMGPGYFATELTAPLVADPEFSAWVERRTPAGRWGTLSDLVGTAIFLASPASDFVNGQVIYVDGGMLAVL